MKIKIKCYVKQVKTPKTSFYTRFTFINSFEDETKSILLSVKFTKDVPNDIIPNVSSTLICDAENVSLNLNLKQVWITKVLDVVPMERPVEDLSQYFETVDEPEDS